MSQTYPLDRVLQRVTANTVATTAAQEIVVVDVTNKQPAIRRSFWRAGDYRYYLVSNDKDPQNVARFELPHVQLSDLDNTASVSLTVQVRCPAGNEQQVAVALGDAADSPSEMFEQYVRRWLVSASRDSVASFVRRYFEDKAAVQNALASAVKRDVGLDLFVKVSLDAERSFNVIRIEHNHLPVMLSDYGEEQDIGLKVDLEVDEASKAAAILHYSRNLELQQTVPLEVGRFMRQKISMQTFCTELNTPRVSEALISYLNDVLKPAGRRVGALVIHAKVPEGLQFFLQEEMDVVCQVQEFPGPVVVNNKVLMRLKDVARYRSANAPELRAWLQDKLSRVVRELLFEARYINLLIRFQPIEEQIKALLVEEARGIGYEIRQLVTVPDLAPIRLKDNFILDVVGTFETRLSNVHVKLHIVVTARIRKLENIEALLNRHQDVPAMMQEAISNVTRQYLHKIDPERFYMRFSFADPDKYPDEPMSVEAELADRITQRLEKHDFHADVIDVVIKMVDTDLIERLKRLQERITSLEIVVAPFQGGAPVTFKADFRVIAVDSEGWHRFQLSTAGLDEIRSRVEDHLLARLQTLPSEGLEYKQEVHRQWMAENITRLAKEYVGAEFGLAVEVSNARRIQTQIEVAASGHLVDRAEARLQINKAILEHAVRTQVQVNESKVAQIEQLLAKRAELVALDGVEAEIQAIDDKIEGLIEALSPEKIPSMDQLETDILHRPPLQLSRQEFSRLLGLPEPRNSRASTEGASDE